MPEKQQITALYKKKKKERKSAISSNYMQHLEYIILTT